MRRLGGEVPGMLAILGLDRPRRGRFEGDDGNQGWKREARVRVEQKECSVIKDLSYQRVRNITQATGEYNRK